MFYTKVKKVSRETNNDNIFRFEPEACDNVLTLGAAKKKRK